MHYVLSVSVEVNKVLAANMLVCTSIDPLYLRADTWRNWLMLFLYHLNILSMSSDPGHQGGLPDPYRQFTRTASLVSCWGWMASSSKMALYHCDAEGIIQSACAHWLCRWYQSREDFKLHPLNVALSVTVFQLWNEAELRDAPEKEPRTVYLAVKRLQPWKGRHGRVGNLCGKIHSEDYIIHLKVVRSHGIRAEFWIC